MLKLVSKIVIEYALSTQLTYLSVFCINIIVKYFNYAMNKVLIKYF